jgi:hypothetical protein
MPDEPQLELDFAAHGAGDGVESWRARRREALLELARKLALPLNHPVEVWFPDGVRLRGRLELHESPLFVEDVKAKDLELAIGGVRFRASEIESFVRLD